MLDGAARKTALQVRKAKIAEGAHFRRDWLDAERWDQLARDRGIHLPRWHTPPTARALKRCLRTLDKEPFEAVFGCSATRLIQLNPTAPLRAFIGQMLEMVLRPEVGGMPVIPGSSQDVPCAAGAPPIPKAYPGTEASGA